MLRERSRNEKKDIFDKINDKEYYIFNELTYVLTILLVLLIIISLYINFISNT